MYALLRRDLQMPHGKAASQAGHAFLDSFLQAPTDNQKAYLAEGGTKIVLSVGDERALCDLFHQVKMAGVPCAMVIEQNHVLPPHFDGSPVATAVGIGPVERSKIRQLTREYPLM